MQMAGVANAVSPRSKACRIAENIHYCKVDMTLNTIAARPVKLLKKMPPRVSTDGPKSAGVRGVADQ